MWTTDVALPRDSFLSVVGTKMTAMSAQEMGSAGFGDADGTSAIPLPPEPGPWDDDGPAGDFGG